MDVLNVAVAAKLVLDRVTCRSIQLLIKDQTMPQQPDYQKIASSWGHRSGDMHLLHVTV
jgi:hypothetical protein